MNWSRISKTVLLLDEEHRLSLDELTEAARIDRDLLTELVELGVLEPTPPRPADPEQWEFPSRSLELLLSARRLREAFDLNTGGLLLALTYRERIRALEDELRRLRCLLGE